MTERSSKFLFVQAHKSPGIIDRLHLLLPWIYESDRRFFDILLQDWDFNEILPRWMVRDESEHGLHRTRLLIAEDRIAGGFVAMPGREVALARESDILDLVRHSDPRDWRKLRERVQDLYPLFGPIRPGDFYISRLSGLPSLKERGYDEVIVEEALNRARQHHVDRVRIDVDEANQRLCSICTAYGFETIDRGRVPNSTVTYLNLARDL